MLVLAHAADSDALGVPEWLLVSAMLLAATLTWLALRTGWPRPRLAGAAGGVLLPAWSATVRRVAVAVAAVAGFAVFALTLTAGLFGVDVAPENLASFVVDLDLLPGGLLLAAVVGGWWTAASPFATIARLLPDRPAAKAAPAWVGPFLFGSFVWLITCYGDNGATPRAAGTWLAAYTLATIAGTLAWGRWWASTGEGFAVVFGSVARMAPLARDEATGRVRVRPPLAGLAASPPPAGATAAALLLVGGAAFTAVQQLPWWIEDVMGRRSGWDERIVDTIGLAFIVGLASLVWLAATRQRADDARPLVPIALAVSVAFLLTSYVERFIHFLALLSDPYDRDWDLLGTADWFPDLRWQSSTRLAWSEIGALLIGLVLSVVVAHDRSLATERGRASAERALLPQLAAGTVITTAALLILLR